MVRSLLLAVLVLAATEARAADDGEFVEPAPEKTDDGQRTLFDTDGGAGVGGWGGPVAKIGPIQRQWALLAGGRGGWVIGETFFLGGGGYGLVNDLDIVRLHPSATRPSGAIDLGYGGGIVGLVLGSDQPRSAERRRAGSPAPLQIRAVLIRALSAPPGRARSGGQERQSTTVPSDHRQ